jgi:hypothetical protein
MQGAQGYVADGFPIGQYEGMWGVFRLFQNAEPREPGDKLVKWSQTRGLGGATPQKLPVTASVQFVEFPGGLDLFNPKFFEALQCPRVAVTAQ